jgi:hypothetical protein
VLLTQNLGRTQKCDGFRTAVPAAKKPLLFHSFQIPSDGGLTGVRLLGQITDAHIPLLIDQLQNLLIPAVFLHDGCPPFAHLRKKMKELGEFGEKTPCL